MFEDRVLRKICGPKREELIEYCRKMHKEKFNRFDTSSNNTRNIK
jgi:hypothetical protein